MARPKKSLEEKILKGTLRKTNEDTTKSLSEIQDPDKIKIINNRIQKLETQIDEIDFKADVDTYRKLVELQAKLLQINTKPFENNNSLKEFLG